MSENLGIDASKVQDSFNHQLSAIITRLRRCIEVKKGALEKIQTTNFEERAVGFTHIQRILNLQEKSYPRYRESIIRQKDIAVKVIETTAQLKPVSRGFFSSMKLRSSRTKVINTVELLNQSCPELVELVENITANCLTPQKSVLKLKPADGDLVKRIYASRNYRNEIKIAQYGKWYDSDMRDVDVVHLRRFIELEIHYTEQIIEKLQVAVEFLFRLMSSMRIIQYQFKEFLIRTKEQKGANIVEDLQGFADTTEKYISAFYLWKSYIQAFGILLNLLVPIEFIKNLGKWLAYGVFGIDYVFDWIAAAPEQRRYLQKWSHRLKGKVDEGQVQFEEQIKRTIEIAKTISAETM